MLYLFDALAGFLRGGERRSWIVVTTRSQETASMIEDGFVHKLQGLSDENSWRLFIRMAFDSKDSNPPNDLVKIGRVVVDRCAQLYGQDMSRWISIQEFGLASVREDHNPSIPILKLSFQYQFKSCFEKTRTS